MKRAALVVGIAIGLAGCGGSDPSSSTIAPASDTNATSPPPGTSGTGGTGVGGGATPPPAVSDPAAFADPGTMTSPSALYTADAKSFTIDETGDALAHAIGANPNAHVLLYIHGRSCGGGGEPSKSLGEAVPELESDYHAKVVMFSWPGSSSGCPLGFPETEARSSGPALSHVLHKLAFALHTNPSLAGVTLTLVPHSMGNLVLEEALATDTRPLPPALFATALLSSSATALAGHAAWLSRLTFSPHVYVSVNDGDKVLTAAATAGGTRLGKSLGTEALAPTALYVDFSAAGVNHAYYLHSGQKGSNMAPFYDTVMAGKPYDFAASKALTRTDSRSGTFVYVFAK